MNVPYASGSSLDFVGTSNLTISWWMKWSGNTSNGVRFIEALATGGWGLEIPNGAGSLKFNCFGSCGAGPVWTGAALPDGKWHQYAATYDGTNNVLYRDGTLVGTVSYSAAWTSGAKTLVFGGDNSIYGYNGQMDSVRIFAKTLTAQEVGGLYAAEAAKLLARP